MAKQRYLQTNFWTDSKVLKLNPSDKMLLVYLMTNEAVNMLGCYELSIAKMSFETGFTAQTIEDMIGNLSSLGFCDYKHDFVYLYSFPKWQNYNDSMLKSAAKEANALPAYVKSEPYFDQMKQAFNVLNHSLEIKDYEKPKKQESKSNPKEASKPKKPKRDIQALNEAFLANGVEPRYQSYLKFLQPMADFVARELPGVASLKDQLTYEESFKLITEYGKDAVKSILYEMENYKDINKKKSVYLTAKTWLNKRKTQ